jgi:hypothetical protein
MTAAIDIKVLGPVQTENQTLVSLIDTDKYALVIHQVAAVPYQIS